MAANILISIFRKRSRDQNLKKQTNKQTKPRFQRIFQWNLVQSRRTWIDLHYWNSFLIIAFQNGNQNNFGHTAQ